VNMQSDQVPWHRWVKEVARTWKSRVESRLDSNRESADMPFSIEDQVERELAAELRCPPREVRRFKRLAKLLEEGTPQLDLCPSLDAAAAFLEKRDGAYLVCSTLLRRADGSYQECSATPLWMPEWPPAVRVKLFETDGIQWLGEQSSSSLDCICTSVGEPDIDVGTHPSVFLSAAKKALDTNGLCILWCRKDLYEDWRSAAEEADLRVQPWPCSGPDDAIPPSAVGKAIESESLGLLLVLASQNAASVRSQLLYHRPFLPAQAKDPGNLRFTGPNDLFIWVLDNLVPERATTVVDPLAGEGQIARAILESGRNVIAVEPDHTRFEQLRRCVLKRSD